MVMDVKSGRAHIKTFCIHAGFEVLTAVVMNNTTFWDITPCSPLSVNRRFGGTYRLHLHGRKNKLNKIQRESFEIFVFG
jgi:hypothetical protein